VVEGLFVKYASAVEHKVPGQHSSNNTVLRLTERHFISKIPPTARKSRPQEKKYVGNYQGKGTEVAMKRSESWR
jgi:hypothetical protein